MSVQPLKTVECLDLPEYPSVDTTYRLLPKNGDDAYYRERTDRNIGWITHEEQKMLRRSVVGIAGCGGMGGLLASIFFRLGVGEVRIADCEVFDISNINRQFAAGRGTVGKSKTFETARMTRAVTDDATLVVYPQGIAEKTAASFLDGCDIGCDEIEFWAVGARILLHQEARRLRIPLFNCNTVGFGTRLFLFRPQGGTMEECLNLSYEEAVALQQRIQERTASSGEVRTVMEAMLGGLVPELPEYCSNDPAYRTVPEARHRLLKENRAPIIATNPPMAAGFLADHVLLYLLRNSSVKRSVVTPPSVPGYLYFDAALMQARAVTRKEVSRA